MTREERENAIRCLKMWIEREPQLQTYRTCLEALEQEPCEDAISRQAVMDALCDGCELFHKNGEQVCLSKCEEYHFLVTLPPVTPKPKSGRWIALENRFELGDRLKCSECDQVFVVGDDVSRNYCPNCGAKMEGIE